MRKVFIILLIFCLLTPMTALAAPQYQEETDSGELVIGLLDNELEGRFINPLGNGISIKTGINWTANGWQKIEIDYPGVQGKHYYWQVKHYQDKYISDQRNFQVKGIRSGLKFTNRRVRDWQLNYQLYYDRNNISGFEKLEQQYIIAGLGASRTDEHQIDFGVKHGAALLDPGQDFRKIHFSWKERFTTGQDNTLVATFNGGLTSDLPPLNYRFKVGQDNSTLLRGHEQPVIANHYGLASLEYQRSLYTVSIYDFLPVNIKGIIFLDGGWIDSNNKQEWELDGGIGTILTSSIGTFEVILGYDDFDESPVIDLDYIFQF